MDLLFLNVLFSHASEGHVMFKQRTVSFKFVTTHMCADEKTRG